MKDRIKTAERTQIQQDFLEAALSYAKLGWRVFPAEEGGKKPLIKGWPEKASIDEKTIHDWWKRWPNANIAIATGRGLGVLDVDYENGGARSIRRLRERGEFPITPTVETGHGCHHYFFLSSDVKNRNRTGLLPGLDWRGEGGYVIAPPSLHPDGPIYSWGITP